jgi:hypothetical protein
MRRGAEDVAASDSLDASVKKKRRRSKGKEESDVLLTFEVPTLKSRKSFSFALAFSLSLSLPPKFSRTLLSVSTRSYAWRTHR